MKKVLYVSSAGGHFSELKLIINGINKKEKFDYIVCTEKNAQTENDSIVNFYIRYGSRKKILKYSYISILNLVSALKIIKNFKPDAIVSTGAHSCVIFFFIGKLFKTKNIYIESFAKVKSPSLTYKIAKKFIDVTYVQHEEMLSVYSNAKFAKGVY